MKPKRNQRITLTSNERLDWMFVDLLTLMVGLLIMQVFILPALRASQAAGVPTLAGKWLQVQLRLKPEGAVDTRAPVPLLNSEWGIYVKCNETNEFTFADDVRAAGITRRIQSPRYGNDGSLSVEFLPREDETYTMGIWLASVSDLRVADPVIQNALRRGLQFRVFAAGDKRKIEEGQQSDLWQWRDLSSETAFHCQIKMEPRMWLGEGS